MRKGYLIRCLSENLAFKKDVEDLNKQPVRLAGLKKDEDEEEARA